MVFVNISTNPFIGIGHIVKFFSRGKYGSIAVPASLPLWPFLASWSLGLYLSLVPTLRLTSVVKMKGTTIWGTCLALAAGLATAADDISPRPSLSFYPKAPYHAVVEPPARCKTCFIDSHGDGVTDDSQAILNAFKECNDGGHTVFKQNQTYVIGTAMDWTFLNHIDIGKLAPGDSITGSVPNLPKSVLMIHRNPGQDPVHRQHHILASQLFQVRFSECHLVLQARRK